MTRAEAVDKQRRLERLRNASRHAEQEIERLQGYKRPYGALEPHTYKKQGHTSTTRRRSSQAKHSRRTHIQPVGWWSTAVHVVLAVIVLGGVWWAVAALEAMIGN
jgi:hypothetical protein